MRISRKVSLGIDGSSAAAFDQRVNDRPALASSGFAHEEPVLFADGGGADRVFNQVVVDLDTAIAQEDFERVPLPQSVIDGLLF